MKRYPKYRNQIVETSAGRFDSRKEYRYWLYYLQLQRQGEITGLQRQVSFQLIPDQYDEREVQLRTKSKTVRKLAEKGVRYVADYVFFDKMGHYTVVDVKSDITRKNGVYRIKKKLMRYLYDIVIKEV